MSGGRVEAARSGAEAQAAHAEVPPGWAYNPSCWSQRLPNLMLGLLAFAGTLHLALYQSGLLAAPWEPFFGDGSRALLDSPLVPAAVTRLVTSLYLIVVATGALGGRTRWRSTPWLVLLQGLLIVPLAALNVLLVILQPTVFGAWSSLCLFTALLSVLMVGPALDELLASLQQLQRITRRGGSVWRALWGMRTGARRLRLSMEH